MYYICLDCKITVTS